MRDVIREIISNNWRYFKDPITITEIGQQLASASRLTVDLGEVRVVLDQLKSDGVISEVKPGAFVPLCAKTTSGGIVMKSLLCAALCFSSLLIATAATVSDVTARQRYPWNGLVDISYTISGDIATMNNPSIAIMAKDNKSGCTYLASTFEKKPSLTTGTHVVTWNPDADGLKINSTDVTFTVSLSDKASLYCLIDISGGSSATKYPVTYLNEVPSGGWTESHKKDYIVLRYCPAGTYMMQGQRKVTLTKPFYMGIFEVTQGQYKNIMGSASPYQNYTTGVCYPATAAYSAIRGANNWPSATAVGTNSFVGKLMAKASPKLSGIDLPTEAQWEYACRAGTVGELSSGKGLNPVNVKEVAVVYEGRLRTEVVGSRKANPWGFYDMHGNVPEMCLDFFVKDLGTAEVTDPKGEATGEHASFSSGKNERVIRGCGWRYPDNGPDYLPEAVSAYSSCARGSTNCQCNSATCGRWTCAFRICMTLAN